MPVSLNLSEIRPLPLILHIGKSHHDLSGRLAATLNGEIPVLFNMDVSQIFVIGDSVQQCQICNEKGKKQEKVFRNKSTKQPRLSQSAQSCIHFFKQNLEGCSRKNVNLKPYIHMIIGDTASNNGLCRQYLANVVWLLTNDCYHRFDDFVECLPKCWQMLWRDLDNWHDDEEILRNFIVAGLYLRQTCSL